MNNKIHSKFILLIACVTFIAIGGCSALQNEAGLNDASDTAPPANGSLWDWRFKGK